ncbi:MAG: hypothetical protein H8E55_71610 [Pelagibacterales bacterium]|nr:hypothetical protein [Pelagibacterales bacterium]
MITEEKRENLRVILIVVGFLWLTYTMIVASSGSCGLWEEKSDNGEWYIYHTVHEEMDAYGNSFSHEEVFMGPVSLKDANQIINECEDEANRFKRKYGTIYNYNLFPWIKDGRLLSGLFIAFFPLYLLYLALKKLNKNLKLKKWK